MPNFIQSLNKPEYLLQPRALVRRVFGRHRTSGMEVVQLPWGLPLEVNTGEAIGRTISHHGLFEISLVEAIFRLTEPSDIFIDAGANIGFMSSAALAAKAKQVVSFEPHPELFGHLTRNLSLWSVKRPEIAGKVIARHEAISDANGFATLSIPVAFRENQGISSLEAAHETSGYRQVTVATTTLTQVLEQYGVVGVLKIDIEGHELTAFTASKESLRAGGMRDILFEDHIGMNSDVSKLLSSLGYSVFGLSKTLRGPVLLEGIAAERFFSSSDESNNLLATRDPERAKQRMAPRGFMCLRK